MALQELYDYRRIRIRPGSWRAVASAVLGRGAERVREAGGVFFGLWHGQIGMGANEGVVMSAWPDREQLARGAAVATEGVPEIAEARGEVLAATVRPEQPSAPEEPGVYAHRWFTLREPDWPEFLSLSVRAWPAFEKLHEARVIGLFRKLDARPPYAEALLLTWYASLAAWERSRPDAAQSDEEREPGRLFARRHELTEATVVATTRLLGPAPRGAP